MLLERAMNRVFYFFHSMTKTSRRFATLALFIGIGATTFCPTLKADDITVPYDPTDDLLAAFGSQCSSSGALTDTALVQGSALKGVITSIYKDPACQKLIPTAESLEADIQAHQQARNDARSNREQLMATVTNLQSAYQIEYDKGTGADQNYLSSLSSEIYSARVSLLKSQADVSMVAKRRPFEIMKSFYNNSKALMDGLAANAACTNNQPSIVGQIGAQILQFSAEWASGMVGAALVAAGGLLDSFVRFIRNHQLASDLRKINASRLSHAIGCTIEGLAATICRARDTQLMIEANAKYQFTDRDSAIAQGINLLARDLGAFTDFARASFAGSRASSPAIATVKIGVITLTSNLFSLGETMNGETSKYEQNYYSNPDQETKELTIRSLIRSLAVNVSTQMNFAARQTTGPIGDSFAEDPDCGVITFYLSNGQFKACRRTFDEMGSSNSCELCVKRVHPELPLPNISEIKATSRKILDLGDAYVAQQTKLYKQNNPQLAITIAETYGQNMKTAKQFLENANAFLATVLGEKDGIAQGHMLKTITRAKTRIEKILKVLNDSALDANAKAEDIAVQLADLLAPSADTNYIPNEISVIVKHYIDVKLVQGKLDGKVDGKLALALWSSTTDAISAFLSNYGSLETIRNQVRAATAMTKANLDTIASVFGEHIEETLKKLSKDLAKDKNANDDLNLLCLRLLAIPSAPKIEGGPNLTKYCVARMYYSVYGPRQHLYFDELARRPYEERACALYDFYRKARLKGNGIAVGF